MEKINQNQYGELLAELTHIVAVSKAGKTFATRSLSLSKETEKALIFTTGGEYSENAVIIPKSQVLKISKVSEGKDTCDIFHCEIPMWLYGKKFFA